LTFAPQDQVFRHIVLRAPRVSADVETSASKMHGNRFASSTNNAYYQND